MVDMRNTRTTQTKGETMKTLHRECLGNGKRVELEVIQEANSQVRFMIDAGGNYGQVFIGTIQEAREEYKRMKKHMAAAS